MREMPTSKDAARIDRRAFLDMDPLRIAGLRTDENAKPCDQRITFAQ